MYIWYPYQVIYLSFCDWRGHKSNDFWWSFYHGSFGYFIVCPSFIYFDYPLVSSDYLRIFRAIRSRWFTEIVSSKCYFTLAHNSLIRVVNLRTVASEWYFILRLSYVEFIRISCYLSISCIVFHSTSIRFIKHIALLVISLFAIFCLILRWWNLQTLL